MRARVHGQRLGEAEMVRTVTLRELIEGWGKYGMAVFHARRHKPLIVGDKLVWIELVD